MLEKYKHSLILVIGSILLLLLCLISLYIGRYPITPAELFRFIFHGECTDPNLPVVLLNIRAPRIIAAIAVDVAAAVTAAASAVAAVVAAAIGG